MKTHMIRSISTCWSIWNTLFSEFNHMPPSKFIWTNYFNRLIAYYSGLEVNIDLPSSRQQLESDYDIYVPVGETQSSLKRFEDAFHKVQALVQKQEILTSHWLTIRTPWDHLHDTLPDKAISDEEIDLEFVMIFNRVSVGCM